MTYRPSPSFLAAAAILIAAACVYAFVAYRLVAMRGDADTLYAALASEAGQESSLESGAYLAEQTKAERAALAGLAIAPGGNPDFITNVETLSRAAKVAATVSSVNATAPKGDKPGSLSLAIGFSGSFDACMRFIALVETMHAAVAVTDVGLQYDEGSDTPWSGTLAVSVLSFDTP